MEATILEKKSPSLHHQNIESYFKTHDPKYIAEDAVFKNMGTGEETKGRDAIAGMLQYFYQVAFNARAEIKNTIITETKALVESDFIGTHIGEFAGIPATNKEVNVPLCVSYDVEDGEIKYARIYMAGEQMMQQLK